MKTNMGWSVDGHFVTVLETYFSLSQNGLGISLSCRISITLLEHGPQQVTDRVVVHLTFVEDLTVLRRIFKNNYSNGRAMGGCFVASRKTNRKDRKAAACDDDGCSRTCDRGFK